MKYIAVFCSANDVVAKYAKSAREFARFLAKYGYGLVWGGSDRGLMKIVAYEVQANGGKIIGISMELLRHHARKNANEMIITKDLQERKATILTRSDAIVLFAGGIGSLDEITEMLELKKHGVHNKPIVILNTDNFYEGLKMQLQRMRNDGFLTKSLEELIYFANTPKEAIGYLNSSGIK